MAQKKKTVEQRVSDLIKKEYEKKLKSEAKRQFAQLQALKKRPIINSLQQRQIEQQQIQKRAKTFSAMVGKAEQLELDLVSINEVPMLQNVERDRASALSPSPRKIIDIERDVTDSFPQ